MEITGTYLLDPAKRLLHIIKVRVLRSVIDLLALPVRKRICHEEIDPTSDQRISSTIRVLVPAVRSADFDIWENSLDFVDFGEKLSAGEVAAVESLRADSDGVDLLGVSGGVCCQCFLVGVEGLFDVSPDSEDCNVRSVQPYFTGKSTARWLRSSIPTLKPLLFAAGRMFCAQSQSLAE